MLLYMHCLFVSTLVIYDSHFLYVLYTYRDSPESTGWREMLELRTESPVLFRMGEMVRDYFYGKIIKEADLDPEETVSSCLLWNLYFFAPCYMSCFCYFVSTCSTCLDFTLMASCLSQSCG